MCRAGPRWSERLGQSGRCLVVASVTTPTQAIYPASRWCQAKFLVEAFSLSGKRYRSFPDSDPSVMFDHNNRFLQYHSGYRRQVVMYHCRHWMHVAATGISTIHKPRYVIRQKSKTHQRSPDAKKARKTKPSRRHYAPVFRLTCSGSVSCTSCGLPIPCRFVSVTKVGFCTSCCDRSISGNMHQPQR